MNGVRLQIVWYNKLWAEVIVPDLHEADRVWAAFCRIKDKRKLPGAGGACMNHVESRRMWDVPVGSIIP